jgi:hypothetical protein
MWFMNGGFMGYATLNKTMPVEHTDIDETLANNHITIGDLLDSYLQDQGHDFDRDDVFEWVRIHEITLKTGTGNIFTFDLGGENLFIEDMDYEIYRDEQ